MSNRYSHLKPFLFPERIAGLRIGMIVPPVHVQMILSDLCNQNCRFCCFRDESSGELRGKFAEGENHNPNRQMPFDKAIEILDDCAAMGVKGIELTGGGEPTIYKRFPEIVNAINARGMKWGLITNGVREQDISTADWVRVSLDAATAETYAQVRQVEKEHFAKALGTIEKWKTNVSFVVTPDNWHEILPAATLARSLGAQSFRVRPQDDRGIGLFSPEALASILETKPLLLQMAAPGFDVDFKIDVELDSMQQGGQDYDRCGYQHFKTWIGADLNLYRCCITAYSERGLIANLRDQRFVDAWANIAMEDFKKFSARGCSQCRYANTNRAINEVLGYRDNEAFV